MMNHRQQQQYQQQPPTNATRPPPQATTEKKSEESRDKRKSRWDQSANNAPREVTNEEEALPEGLKQYAHRCLSRCKNEMQKKHVTESVSSVISNAQRDGTLHRTDWDRKEPLPLSSGQDKFSKGSVINNLAQPGTGSASSNWRDTTQTGEHKNHSDRFVKKDDFSDQETSSKASRLNNLARPGLGSLSSNWRDRSLPVDFTETGEYNHYGMRENAPHQRSSSGGSVSKSSNGKSVSKYGHITAAGWHDLSKPSSVNKARTSEQDHWSGSEHRENLQGNDRNLANGYDSRLPENVSYYGAQPSSVLGNKKRIADADDYISLLPENDSYFGSQSNNSPANKKKKQKKNNGFPGAKNNGFPGAKKKKTEKDQRNSCRQSCHGTFAKFTNFEELWF
mmetsp:Transcript_5617/g.7177  ORF Transcript_5617/g.7177 Transcript_5617/m.7177 type:complete len:393 (-) Transcript_5617:1574-2752(-)